MNTELHRLFVAKTDGTISPEDHERLSALLKESAEARREWFAFQDAEAALLAWAQRESVRREEGAGIDGPKSWIAKRRAIWPSLGALVAGIVIGLTTWGLWPKEAEPGEATTSSVALLSRGVSMVWDQSLAAPAVNAPLQPGLLRLQSGVAEIEFFQGARLCIEGPAEIQLISAGEVSCLRGRFSVHVPPQARGFRIGTPQGDIVDLGTDFGLDLNDVSPELHVFNGEVELYQPQATMRKLTTGLATSLVRSNSNETLAANAAAFTFSQDLESRVEASGREFFARWQETSARWNEDPAARVRLDFQDDEGSRSLRNSAAHGQEIAAATIVGCNWADGRWPGKRALQFCSVSDRARLNIPGEYRQLTLSAWVQLHSLSTRQNQSSICMSQGIAVGGIHWQVLHDGSLCLGIIASAHPSVADDYVSPVVFTPERFGQWVHLAAVLDTASGEVRFYVDGRRLSRHPLKRPIVAKPELAELGNWIPSPDYRGRHTVRNFVGCMDEFSLFARALNDDELKQLAQ